MIYVIHSDKFGMKAVSLPSVSAAKAYIELVEPLHFIVLCGEYIGGNL